MRTMPGAKQVNWWLPEELLAKIKEYQHDRRLDHMKDAAQELLESGLRARKTERKEKGGE